MSGKSSSGHKKPISSRISRFKKHVSSVFSLSAPLPPPSGQVSSSHYPSPGMFNQAHNFVMNSPVFIDSNTTVDNFMKEFLLATIIGAEFDSSGRDPPPRCHPGTRLAIIQRCLDFIEGSDEEKLRWVVGPAGVGKSAIMQIVAEKTPDSIIFASVFLSVNGRQDGTKTVVTIAYQLAVKCAPYRQFVQNEISRDPSLLRKSLSVHFRRFIVEPFIHRHLFSPSDRFLAIIDGLDECDNPLTQQELLELISDFCIKYPTSPIVWIVSSRPDPHITSFFEKAEIQPVYTKEEMEIDSDQACEDVQHFLRDELKKIQLAYPSLRRKREWPSKLEFTEIATAAGGLFAYASTVVRYIGDLLYQDPTTRLRYVLGLINAVGKDDMLPRDHPMAQLDALYTRILSNVPDDVMINTRRLLILSSHLDWQWREFRQQCNRLGLTEDVAYSALCHLRAVLKVPEPDKADEERLEYFHKSFGDFLFDFTRSGFSGNVEDEFKQLNSQISCRIIEEVPDDFDGMASGERMECGDGYIKGGPGLCDNVSLSWPGDERFKKTDDELRIELYCHAMLDTSIHFISGNKFYGSMFSFQALTTRFAMPCFAFPYVELLDSAFEQFCHELTELGQLKQVPLRAIDYAAICGHIELQFMSPVSVDDELSASWNPSCKHGKRELHSLEHQQSWKTRFRRPVQVDPNNENNSDAENNSETEDNLNTEDDVAMTDIPRFKIVAGKQYHHECFSFRDECNYCSRRLARYFVNNLDQPATIFVDSTEMCYVEFSFVDPDDGVSEWRYRLFHSGLPTNIYT